MFQNRNATLDVQKEDFNIFIINENNLRNSINYLSSLIKARTRQNQEYWLIDISSIDSIETAELLLDILNMDVDDDIFVVKFDEKTLEADIWEIYKLSFAQPLIKKYIGLWSETDGLNMTTLEKYQRRGDLMVNKYLVISIKM